MPKTQQKRNQIGAKLAAILLESDLKNIQRTQDGDCLDATGNSTRQESTAPPLRRPAAIDWRSTPEVISF